MRSPLARVRIQHCKLLEPRMKIATNHDHDVRSFLHAGALAFYLLRACPATARRKRRRYAIKQQVVRATVEETLNALQDTEAHQLCGARKYERAEGRKDTRAGSYERQLQTKAGKVSLKVPKLGSPRLRPPSSSATGVVSLRWKNRS
jgi:hypothetical protein